MLFNVLFPKPLGRHQQADQKNFIFMTDGKVYANKTINQGSLKIFPFGNVQRAKEVKEDEKQKKHQPKVSVKLLGGGAAYQIMQPKVNVEKQSGAIPLFFWVGATKDEDLVNMEVQDVKYENWLSIPCLKNSRQIKAGQQLLVAVKDEEDEQPKKKAKKA